MKKTIGIIILILLIIVVILSYIMLSYKKKDINGNSEEGRSAEVNVTNGEIIKYPENRTDCFTAIRLVNEYMHYLVRENSQELINIISAEYVKDASISSNNIIREIKDNFIQYSRNYNLIVNKIYMSETNSIQTYFLDLIYYNKDNNQKYSTKLMIDLDVANATYQITPYKYMQKKGYDKLKIGDKFEIKINRIENKQNNIYSLSPVSKNSMPERYFSLYSTYLKCDKEASYYLLDKEYREKKFGSMQEYVKYVTENRLEDATMSKYQVKNYDDYTQYVCVDNSGRYYIFNENSVMNFRLILDTYTIDLPEFIEKYNSADENQKIALNIDKFMSAINAKDYKYAYNCLAGSFKNNYFKTEAEFENYAKANFYDNNTVTYNNFEKQGDLYTYSITIIDAKTKNKKQKTFIMQLGEGTQFVMSFDVGR